MSACSPMQSENSFMHCRPVLIELNTRLAKSYIWPVLYRAPKFCFAKSHIARDHWQFDVVSPFWEAWRVQASSRLTTAVRQQASATSWSWSMTSSNCVNLRNAHNHIQEGAPQASVKVIVDVPQEAWTCGELMRFSKQQT